MASSRRLDTDFAFRPILGVGDLISRTYQVYFEHFQWVLYLALFFFSPILIAKNLWYSFSPPESKLIKLWIDSSVLSLPTFFTAPTLVFILVKSLGEGKAPPFGEALRWGFNCFPRNFGYHFVTGLFTILGLVFLVVPGILVLLWYSLLTVVITVEGPEQADPMGRSKALVQKHMGLLFGAGILVTLIGLLCSTVSGGVIGFVNGLAIYAMGERGPFVATEHWAMASLIELMAVMFNMAMGVLALCCYLGWTRESNEVPVEKEAPAVERNIASTPAANAVPLVRAKARKTTKAAPKNKAPRTVRRPKKK